MMPQSFPARVLLAPDCTKVLMEPIFSIEKHCNLRAFAHSFLIF